MSGIRDAVDAAVADVEEPTEEFDTLAYHEQPSSSAAPGSALDTVRARAAQLATENTIDIAVPGYDGLLVARYRAVAINRAYADVSRDPRNPINDWGVAADTLGRAIDEVLYVNDAGELTHLADRFDDELCEAIGLHPDRRTARDVLVTLCGGSELGQSRLWGHFMEYQAWLMAGDESPTQEVAARAVGESRRT